MLIILFGQSCFEFENVQSELWVQISCDKKCPHLQSRNHQKDMLQKRSHSLIMFITRKPRMSCVLVASLALEAPMSSGLICKLYFIQRFVFLCPGFPIFFQCYILFILCKMRFLSKS